MKLPLVLILSCCLLTKISGQEIDKFYKDSLEVISLLDKAYDLENSNLQKAIETYKVAAETSKTSNFHLGSFRANSYIAIVYSNLAEYDSAIYYNKKALPFAERIEYFKGIAATYINLGNIYHFQGNFEKVTENYIRGIDVFEIARDSVNMSTSYQNLAALYAVIEDLKSEAKYLELALKVLPDKSLVQRGVLLGDLGLLNMRTNRIARAKTFFDEAAAIASKVNNQRLDFFVNYHYGEYHLNMKLFDEAIKYYKQALTIITTLNEDYYVADVHIKLGELYATKGDFAIAEANWYKALDIVKPKGMKELEFKIYDELAFYKAKQGNYKLAFDYQSKSLKLKDSLKNESLITKINFLEKQFETEKKNATIKSQQLELAENENKITQQRMTTYFAFGIAICLLALTVASWLIFKQRQKRKDQELLALKNEAQVNALESLIEGEEKERLRIAKELHDGVNGDLSAIKHKLNTLLEMNNKTIEEAVVMIDKSCEQVRAISHNLVPPALENFDLQTAAADYCTNMTAIHKPEIVFEFIGQTLHLPKIIEVNIFRIIQELVTNAIKHANATNIDVQLSSQDDNLQLSVDDNGVGFDLVNTNGDGVGLSNIKNRAAFLNAEVDISSSEKGTSVNLFMDKTTFKID